MTFNITYILKNYKISKVFLVSFMFMIFIPIDMINGVLLRSGFPSLSAPYKLVVLTLVSIYLLKHNKQLYVIGVYSIISLFLLVHTFILSDISVALKGIDILFKFSAIIIFYLFFTELIKKQDIEYLFLISLWAFSFLAVNIFIGALGFGYGMYGGAIGTKGFIFAGNELGAAVIVSGAILMIKINI